MDGWFILRVGKRLEMVGRMPYVDEKIDGF